MFLCSKSWIEENKKELNPWELSAYEHFSTMMTDKKNPYPCVPGIQGFSKDMLRFGFAGDPRQEASAKHLSVLLKEYGKISRDTGSYASLVVFFDSRSISTETDVEDYREFFWKILNNVHKYDEKPWPENIPQFPDHHEWEFCFDEEPYFSFCATPSHSIRKSRFFPYFLIAFQPRWVFEEINSSTKIGSRLKNVIRKRLVEYDQTSPHPALKWYGQEDNYEWKQYFLSEDETSPSKCPFMAIKNKLKSLRS
ncbi:YqcI/YcgG family protein [Halobacillus mangrovi]|uniref:YqcI/YcgG family protein n=1 Tax=Halobacillus mangrovi TaxID=402384 RepID=UPI003D96C7BF